MLMPNVKFGKLERRLDPRTLALRDVLPVKLPAPPREWDKSFNLDPGIWPIPPRMYANDDWGDCVIAGRGHAFSHMEKYEQGQLVTPTDDEVLREYWREQGDPDGRIRPDNGLYVLNSLNSWRREGWVVGGKIYKIHAYGAVNYHSIEEVKLAIWLFGGGINGVVGGTVQVGVGIYESDMDQIDRGEIWSVSGRGNYLGGHLMDVKGYTMSGPMFSTWGIERQPATWDWWLDRVDECYAIVDDRDTFINSPLNLDLMDSYLATVT